MRFYEIQELEPFYTAFKPNQIKVLLFDDLKADPQTFLKELFEFVGVSPDFVPDMSKRGREGGLPKQPWLHKLLTQRNPIRATAASIIKLILTPEKRQRLRTQLVKGNIAKQKLDHNTRTQLIDIYREDIQRLQTLINRDLSSWLS